MASRNRQSGRAKNQNNESAAPVANSAPASTTEQRAAESAQGETNVEQTASAASTPNAGILVFKGTNKSGKSGSYTIPGQVGSVRVAKSAITNETFPQNFSDLVFKQPDADRLAKQAKKAERQGARATSAAERAAKLEARIAKAQAAAQKNADKLAKIRAKMPVTAQEQTEAAVAEAGGGESVPAVAEETVNA